MLNYDNNNCLGNALTYNKPCSFSARITNNNNIQFNSSTYISFGDKSQFSNIVKISFNINDSLLSAPISGKWHICSNIINNGNYWIKRATYDYDSNKLEILVNNTLYSFLYSIPNWKSALVTISLNSSGVPTAQFSDQIISNPTITTVEENDDGCAYFNAYKINNNEIEIGVLNYNINYALDFIDSNEDILFSYNLNEGADYIVYNRVSDYAHGRLITSDINISRYVDHIFKYPYNTLLGFSQDDDQNIAISKAKIPQDKNLVIYKSAFSAGVTDNWKNGYGISDCNIINNKLNASVVTNDSNARIQLTDDRLLKSQINRKFHVRYKITNTSTANIEHIFITIGAESTNYNGLGYTSENNSNVNIAPNDSFENEFDLTIGNGEDFTSIIQILCTYNQNLELNTSAFSVDYIEISQVNHLQNYPRINNGKNNSESNLDYTGTIQNIAELKYCDFCTTGPIFYPKVWYSSNFNNSIDSWIQVNGNLSNINNKLNITIPANNSNTSIKTWHATLNGFQLYDSFRNGIWNLKCKIHNETTSDWNNQPILFYIGGDSDEISLASLSLSLNTTANGETIIDSDFIGNTKINLFYTNTLLSLAINSGFVTDTTVYRSLSLSDIILTFTPNESSYAPMYFSFDSLGNYKNILIYRRPQNGINLKRILYKLKTNK